MASPRSLHSLTSDFVAAQLALRVRTINDVRLQPDGRYVLYWMQSTHRFEDNWALRFAVLEADRLNVPLLVHQGLDPTYEHASDRIHSFIIQNARELARRAPTFGLEYQFVLRRTRSDDRRVVDRLASRATIVVTDDFPTCGIAARTARFASRAPCRVVAVESHCVVPSAHFDGKEEFAARTIRPKLAKLRDLCLEPVEDRAPRQRFDRALLDGLDITPLAVGTLSDAALTAELACCEIDHSVPPVSTDHIVSGLTAARDRLADFTTFALEDYAERRNEPTDRDGSSRMSPYLHFGQISAAEVARAAIATSTHAITAAIRDRRDRRRENGRRARPGIRRPPEGM